ncbi:MAG: prephenate dehydrogenase [Anaerolineae bacterium]|nr:prephenate dehydrogenase [Anaerolineae bacterium]
MHVNVTIIGMDRLGASFGLALKRYETQGKADHSFTIIGSDPKAYPMKTAKKLGAIDNFNRAVLKATANADLLIVNVPASEQDALYERLGPTLKPGSVVLDTSLLKMPVIDLAARTFPSNDRGEPLAYLVGITAIVNPKALYGGDLSVDGARADLFDEADVLITPDTICPAEAVALAENVTRLIGGQPRFMGPVEHDGLIAATEELPMLVGAALFYTLRQSEGWMELRRMVNPTLALAMHALQRQSAQDLFELFSQNRDNLARHLEMLIGTLDQVRDSLTAGADDDAEELAAFLSFVGKTWEDWDIKRYSSKWEDKPGVEMLPGPLGGMGRIFTMSRRDEDDADDTD